MYVLHILVLLTCSYYIHLFLACTPLRVPSVVYPTTRVLHIVLLAAFLCPSTYLQYLPTYFCLLWFRTVLLICRCRVVLRMNKIQYIHRRFTKQFVMKVNFQVQCSLSCLRENQLPKSPNTILFISRIWNERNYSNRGAEYMYIFFFKYFFGDFFFFFFVL